MKRLSRLDALVEVVEYLIEDEEEDYNNEPRPGHIYLSLRVLEQWLKEGIITGE